MHSRSDSGVKLDNYACIVQNSILKFQDAVTGLFSASNGQHGHAWVRDNVYSCQAVWGLSMAYKKLDELDEDKAKAYELEQAVVKCMRSLLCCMIRQAHKVEQFKITQLPQHALHAKYCKRTLQTVVGDGDWGHLQLDATGFFLLSLAQMTVSGLKIVQDYDEVDFIQNLVFYISTAYRTPDYGVWERGDKTNHGVPELNASSVGMCKAALEALDELNLFGSDGGPESVIHVTPDEKALCKVILESMLPRESNSKEVDAGLLSVIGYPAYAVNDDSIVQLTKNVIIEKLQGRYGCKRFLRDGYKTACEDPSRLHYEAAELKVFEHIECEWPVFWTFLALDGLMSNNKVQADQYVKALDDLLVTLDDGIKCVPELYTVPKQNVQSEKLDPGSQDRVVEGKVPHLWGQSLYLLGRLIWDGLLDPDQVDPLKRRFAANPKPDVVVQVVPLAEDKTVQSYLKSLFNIEAKTKAEVSSVNIRSARLLSQLYSTLGRNEKMQLSGRPHREMGILSTSKIYIIQDELYLFIPKIMDDRDFYISLDTDMLMDTLTTELQYLATSWVGMTGGRPLVVLPVHRKLLVRDVEGDDDVIMHPSFVTMLKKLQSGYLNGVRVNFGSIEKFLSTTCESSLTFLNSKNRDVSSEILNSTLKKEESTKIIRNYLKLNEQEFIDDHDKTMQNTSASKKRFDFRRRLSRQKSIDENRLKQLEEEMKQKSRIQMQGDDWLLDEMLRKSNKVHEQAEIIMKICHRKGLQYKVRINDDVTIELYQLVDEILDWATKNFDWLLIRQMSSLLKKCMSGLSESVTDVLVRQKQVTVGFPRLSNEITITRPVSDEELYLMISNSFGDDHDFCVLAQEIILYLGMFVRSSPKLFNDLLRLRVGLIIQVMASELSLNLKCTGETAMEYLIRMSPFETKLLLYNLLSGKEFGVMKSVNKSTKNGAKTHQLSVVPNKSSKNWKLVKEHLRNKLSFKMNQSGHNNLSHDIQTMNIENSSPAVTNEENVTQQSSGHKKGLWLRRRRIDGALNRVPQNFYNSIWKLLEKCQGIVIGGNLIPGCLTKEMTAEELKFALHVENVLNKLAHPEYRQLVVESLVMLGVINSNNSNVYLHTTNVDVCRLLHVANDMFAHKQKQFGATDTFLSRDPDTNICQEFYDCAPSGKNGTMTYISSSIATCLSDLLPPVVNQCLVS